MAAEQNISQTETQPSAAPQEFHPRGIGTAVVFDWALATQTALGAVFIALAAGPNSDTASLPTVQRLGMALVFLAVAVGAAFLGEAMRRGVRVVWMAQIVINALLFFIGVHDIPDTIQSVKNGHWGLFAHTFVLLIISPALAWMLTRKPTRDWIAHTTRAEARKRHGGKWVVYIIVWAIICGAIIAFGPLY